MFPSFFGLAPVGPGPNSQLMTINARYLNHLSLLFGLNSQLALQTNNDGQKATWNLRHRRFLHVPQTRLRICLIHVNDWPSVQIPLATFALNLAQYLANTGFNVNQANQHIVNLGNNVNTSNRATMVTALDAAHTRLDQLANPDHVRLVIVALTSKNADTYANVKWWGDCRRGVRTLCITRNSLVDNFNMSNNVATNASYMGNLR